MTEDQNQSTQINNIIPNEEKTDREILEEQINPLKEEIDTKNKEIDDLKKQLLEKENIIKKQNLDIKDYRKNLMENAINPIDKNDSREKKIFDAIQSGLNYALYYANGGKKPISENAKTRWLNNCNAYLAYYFSR